MVSGRAGLSATAGLSCLIKVEGVVVDHVLFQISLCQCAERYL